MKNELENLSPLMKQNLSEIMREMEPELTVEEIKEMLEYTQKGAVKNNRHNCRIILEQDPILKGAFQYGIKFEYMLCIVGGQGIGKSTFFRLLAINDDWFTDDIKRLDDENIYRRLRGHLIVELSEMVATARAKSIEETKSFLSRQKETYKDLYAIHAVDRPRQCVFGGTSNKKKFLPFDRTGNRRFIPVQADRSQMEVHILDNEKESRAYLEQVWAEAMVIYRSGDFKLAFSKEVEEALDEFRMEFMAEDTEAGVIQAWLNDHEDQKVCSLMIFKEALDNPYVKPKKSDTDRICEIMNTLIQGWEP